VERAKTVRTMAMNAVPPELHDGLHQIYGKLVTPDEFKAFEALTKRGMKEAPLPGHAAAPEPVTLESLQAMQRDDRYHNPRHPEFESYRRKVSQGYEMLIGRKAG
jgi:hypothetical protein